MNILTTSFLIFLHSFATTLNVQSFGATGNGTTDDSNAINTALAAAKTQGKSLFFPTGVYLCNTKDGGGTILTFDGSSTNNITIYGSNATIKTSINSASTLFSISAFNRCHGLVISGLTFLNTHGKLTGITTGIQLAGTIGDGTNGNIDTAYIVGNTFAGFSQHITAQGVSGFWIWRNIFNAPHGHDDAQQNTDPAVDIWLFDNQNGFCRNIDIEFNQACGYTGTFPMNCRRPMDGFVYGTSYGYFISNNQTKWFSEEHYAIAPVGTFPNTTATITVTGNYVDCSLPPGAVDDDNTPHKQNYGIRVDANNATISKNDIINYTWGILVRGIDYPSLTLHGYNILNNNFWAPAPFDTTYIHNGNSIFIQGSSNLISGVVVQGNNHVGIDSIPYQILSCSSPLISGNPFSRVKLN